MAFGAKKARAERAVAVLAAAFVFTLFAVLAPSHALVQAVEHEALVTSQLAEKVAFVDLATWKVDRRGRGSRQACRHRPVARSPQRLCHRPRSQGTGGHRHARARGRQADAVGNGPLGVAVHPVDGRIFVADWYDHRLRSSTRNH